MRKERFVAVSYYVKGQPILTVPRVEEDFRDVLRGCCRVGRHGADVRARVIREHDNRVEPVVFGEGAGEIHCDGVATPVGNWQGAQGAAGLDCSGLVALAFVAGGDIRLFGSQRMSRRVSYVFEAPK